MERITLWMSSNIPTVTVLAVAAGTFLAAVTSR